MEGRCDSLPEAEDLRRLGHHGRRVFRVESHEPAVNCRLFRIVGICNLSEPDHRDRAVGERDTPQIAQRRFERAPHGFGPLHALNADIRRIKADSNAARLSSALTEELRKLGAHADPLPVEASHRPSSGWLVQGVFYAMDENSRLISVPFIDKGPNVEVSVTVADYAQNPDWTSQDSVDTSASSSSSFEFLGTYASQMTMAASRIVE